MSVGFFSIQSVNSREICSFSMLLPESRFFLVLSMELVRHFLKMY
jgi:hypothetical protein